MKYVLRFHPWLAAFASALPLLAAATPPAAGGPPPAIGYRSAFADYEPYRELAPADWRAANDRAAGVERRPEAAAAERGASAAVPAPAAASQAMHGMHDMHAAPHPMDGTLGVDDRPAAPMDRDAPPPPGAAR
jgi:hypothetical protein